MSWVTFIWAAVMGACATMALPHLVIGVKRRAWENLFFAIAALAVAGVAFGELAIMHSRTTEEVGRALQLTHLPVFFLCTRDCRIRLGAFWDGAALAWNRSVCSAADCFGD